jgi:hypothetical protein
MGDFSWADMPEELAGFLYEAATSDQPEHIARVTAEMLEWVGNEMVTCAATWDMWTSLPEARCGDLPVPGSEFCPVHMPPGELGEDANIF